MTRVEIHMKISRKMKSTPSIPIYLKILQDTKRWRSKKIFNSLHPPEDKKKNWSFTTGRHTIGGALPPGAFLAQSQDNLEEWFLLGLTCALVVRKRSGLRRQIWHSYQDWSINALVYHPQRTASSRLKVYTNIKHQDATPRIEDSINIHEGSDDPKPTKATQEASTLHDLSRVQTRLTLIESFQAY
jgi:hypothetical protein